MRFPGGKPKAVTLSYDDGFNDDIRFLETIDKYGLKCTFNLIGNIVENEYYLSKEFIKSNMLAKGHEVANHGFYHRALNKNRPLEGIAEILDGRRSLEKALGNIIRGMAYPDCTLNRFTEPDAYKRVRDYLKEMDIAYSRSGGGDNDKFKMPEDWLNWIPTAHHNNPEILEYIDKFVNLDISSLYRAQRDPRLFYMWGHSFEFTRNDNWNRIDEICCKLAGKDDIWYATNIEIYDYTIAYNSLKYSADGSIVYNPTLFEIWFDIDGTLYSIKPGETLKIKL